MVSSKFSRQVAIFVVLFSLFGMLHLPQAQAGCAVTVKNETGYDLVLLKYVKEDGVGKKVMGQTALKKGGAHTFNLGTAGTYRAYASLMMDGQLKYAKGNAYTVKDGTRAELKLLRVVANEKGSSISFINQDEFDRLK
jgi:hypothetical protein